MGKETIERDGSRKMCKITQCLIRVWCVVLCVAHCASHTVGAHEPLASWTEARLSLEALTLEVVLTPGEARLLVTDDLDNVPYIYPGQFEEIKPLFLEHAVEDLYALYVDGELLAWDRADVFYDAEKDDVIFWLVYPKPSGQELTFWARYLNLMPEEHEATLLVFNADGHSLGWEILIRDNEQFVVDLTSQKEVSGWDTFKRFLTLGVEHILGGYDHLLFLGGLLLVCQRLASMALIISCFTLAHSITLLFAALKWVVLPGDIVEPLIAASIVYVGVENLWRVPQKRWLLTFVFGLIHGFGFASVLQETGLGAQGFVLPLFSFNLGVEAGQLFVAAIFLPLLLSLRKWPRFVDYGVPALSVSVVAFGGYWFITRVFFS